MNNFCLSITQQVLDRHERKPDQVDRVSENMTLVCRFSFDLLSSTLYFEELTALVVSVSMFSKHSSRSLVASILLDMSNTRERFKHLNTHAATLQTRNAILFDSSWISIAFSCSISAESEYKNFKRHRKAAA